MVDFRKKLGKKDVQKKVDPIEIYDTLDRKSETGPLRPAQEYVLRKWYDECQNEKDLIIKLHTGEGKTLIGLLLLLSKVNAGQGPCLYVCPSIYLVDQVCAEAEKFGIPICKIEKDKSIPNEFLDGKSILVTHIQKLFNGRSVFGIKTQSLNVNSIILDDSHACIESIKNSLSICIPNDKKIELYSKFKSLFEDDLKEQGEGSFYELENKNSNVVLPIPYWSWNEKRSQVVKMLAENLGESFITFSWPILRDRLEYCQAFISFSKIEISPLYIPIDDFGTFSKAKQRVLMSATTQDDSFFIKGLNFSLNSIKNPLINPSQKWSGEKMIIIPSAISDDLDRELVLTNYARMDYKKFGAVSLVSSFKKAEYYSNLGATVVDGENYYIDETVNDLKNGKYGHMVVLVNRYDGIDLPDNACRMLILDSLPFFDALSERYEEQCRGNSDLINIKIAQKIEQGLGRSVRGEKDYSVIVIVGADLVKFVKGNATRQYFSSQTKKQIDVGLEIAEMAKEDIDENESSIKLITSLINQSLNRDEAWKNYYLQEMEEIEHTETVFTIHNILQKEKEAMDALISMDRNKAYSIFQEIADSCSGENDKAWYMQMMAFVKYFDSKAESNKLQLMAFKKNSELLKPKDGIVYEKINYINKNRINKIREELTKFQSHQDIMIYYDGIFEDLSFDNDSDKFERALQEVGLILGFESQRPDKDIRKGPDNLWCVELNKYMMFECKNKVSENRNVISKKEAGQMDQHCDWFEDEYGKISVKRIMIISTKDLSHDAYFARDVEIMRKSKLKNFKNNIRDFLKEFKPYVISEIDDSTINQWIFLHKLDIESLFSQYSEKPYRKNQ